MAYDTELADRIRAALATQRSVREAKMFGGLSFMVNGKMAVCAMGDGALLVRADPERSDELLSTNGARPAEMGAGRTMGKDWIAVSEEALTTEADLGFWISVALEYNGKQAGTRSRDA